MKRKDIRACILRMEGTNCEEETLQAFRALGVGAEHVHLKQLTGEVGSAESRDLLEYQILVIPGGFSAGDSIRAGAIFAARMKAKLRGALNDFVGMGYPVGGICNGFQVLVELGLLPALDRSEGEAFSTYPEAALAFNESGRFECRPVFLERTGGDHCPFLHRVPKGRPLLLPVAHAEGRLLFPPGREEEFLDRLDANGQVALRYVDPSGKENAPYPWNPNGSTSSIAGLCSPDGTVFGLMPHPERAFTPLQHPEWTRHGLKGKRAAAADGRPFFESVIGYVEKRF